MDSFTKSNYRSLYWALTYYVIVVITTFARAFIFSPDSGAFLLAKLATSLPACYWLIFDAKARGIFVPHVLRPVILYLWWIIVTVYLVATRKWMGLLFAVFHVVLSIVLSTGCYFLAIYLAWGPDAFLPQ